jgi:hypothetical protein
VPAKARQELKEARQVTARPAMDAGMAAGWLSPSWAAKIREWAAVLPEDEARAAAEQILLDAAQAEGVTLIDLRNLAALLIETWRIEHGHPDTDDDDDFRDRHLQLDLTLGGAGRLTGDLTPECGAAVRAVIDALGKRRGKEDTRTANQRYHDALQEACELLIRAKMVPDRAGSDTHVDVHVALGELLTMDGASVLTEAWLRARSGEEGYLFGDDARAIACDALIVPVVTGSPDWDVVGDMIGVVLDAFGWHDDATTTAPGAPGAGTAGAAGTAGGRPSAPLSPEAWQALQYALARFLSGPGGLASVLRTGLLPGPVQHPQPPPRRRRLRPHSRGDPPRRHPPRRPLRLARLRPAPRPVRRPPLPAPQRRRPHLRRTLRPLLQFPPRHLHPPLGLGNRTPARRIRQSRQSRRPGDQEPRTATAPGRLTGTPPPAQAPHHPGAPTTTSPHPRRERLAPDAGTAMPAAGIFPGSQRAHP